MKPFLLFISVVLFADTTFGQPISIPGSSFPVVTTPSNDMRFLMVYPPGGLSLNPNAARNATVTYTDLLSSASSVLSISNANQISDSAILKTNGLGFNTTVSNRLSIFGNAVSFDRGLLDIRMSGSTPDGMPLSIHSSTNEVAVSGIHYQTYNTNAIGGAKAVDIGLWSDGFGPDYTGAFAFDLYNTNLANSTASAFVAPNFLINVSDARDGGVVNHPVVWIDATNLTFNLPYRTNNSRLIIPGLTWDPTIGVMPFHNSAENKTNASGTVTGSGSTITGTGTHFSNSRFGEAGFGDRIVVGFASYSIKSVSSDTSATVAGPISPSFTGSNYSVYRAPVRFYDVNGTAVSAIGPDGVPIVKRSGDGAWMRMIGTTKDYMFAEGGSGEFIIQNTSDPLNSFIMTSAGALTLSAGLSATTVTLSQTNAPPANTNAARIWIPVTNNGTMYLVPGYL